MEYVFLLVVVVVCLLVGAGRAAARQAAADNDGSEHPGQLHRLSAKLKGGHVRSSGLQAQLVEGLLGVRQVEIDLRRPYKGVQPVDYRVRLESKLCTMLRATDSGVPVYRQVFQDGEDQALSLRALSDQRVQKHLKSLFTGWAIDRLEVGDGWITATHSDRVDFDTESHERTMRLLQRVVQLARAVEAVAGKPAVKATVRIKRVGTEICPYCKDALGAELDLITCGRCNTIHHAECFTELGRCTALGCQGRRAFPLLRQEEGVVEPLTLDFTPCEECGATDQGCTPEICSSRSSERRRHARRQAHFRAQIRREQHRSSPRQSH